MWTLLSRVLNKFLGAADFLCRKLKVFNSALFWGSFGERELYHHKLNKSYDNKKIANNYLERYNNKKVEFGERERQLLLPVFYCLNKLKKADRYSNFTFADLCGGLGLHFDTIKHFSNLEDIHSYRIIETASICNIYNESAALHTDHRKLFHTVDELPFNFKADIFLIIGSLQYMDNWKDILQKVFASASFVIIDRLPLISGDTDFLSTQYVKPPIYDHSTSYPITYISKSNFESEIRRSGLAIDFFHEDKISQSSLNWKYVKNYTYVLSHSGASS